MNRRITAALFAVLTLVALLVSGDSPSAQTNRYPITSTTSGTVATSAGRAMVVAASAAAQLTLLGAVPTTRTIAGLDLSADRTAAALLTALAAAPMASTTYDFSSSSGITTSNGTVGGSASVTGGLLRCTCPSTPAARYYGSNLEAPYADIAVPRDASGRQPTRWRARVRVVAVPSGTVPRMLAINAAASQRASIYMGSDGSGGFEDNVGPSSYATVAAAGMSTGGSGWWEIEVNASTAIARYGTGTTSTPPTTWTEIGSATAGAYTLQGVSLWTKIRLVGSTNSAPGGAVSIDFDDLTIESL